MFGLRKFGILCYSWLVGILEWDGCFPPTTWPRTRTIIEFVMAVLPKADESEEGARHQAIVSSLLPPQIDLAQPRSPSRMFVSRKRTLMFTRQPTRYVIQPDLSSDSVYLSLRFGKYPKIWSSGVSTSPQSYILFV